jgi:hypothetical protein
MKFSFHETIESIPYTIAVYQDGTSDPATPEQISQLLLVLNEKAAELMIEDEVGK